MFEAHKIFFIKVFFCIINWIWITHRRVNISVNLKCSYHICICIIWIKWSQGRPFLTKPLIDINKLLRDIFRPNKFLVHHAYDMRKMKGYNLIFFCQIEISNVNQTHYLIDSSFLKTLEFHKMHNVYNKGSHLFPTTCHGLYWHVISVSS